MKKFFAIAAALLLAAAAFAQDGKSIYRKYSDEKNVSAVYISTAMFRLVGKLPDLEIGDGEVNVASIVKSLDGMYILESENPDVNARMVKDVSKWVGSSKYEMLMEVKDNGETVNIYTAGTEKEVTSLVLVAADHDDCTFICLDGKMPREELEKLIASAME